MTSRSKGVDVNDFVTTFIKGSKILVTYFMGDPLI